MSEIVIRGTVGDVIGREEIGQHIVKDAVRHHIHEGEEVARIIPDDETDHPLHRLEGVPIVGWVLAEVA